MWFILSNIDLYYSTCDLYYPTLIYTIPYVIYTTSEVCNVGPHKWAQENLKWVYSFHQALSELQIK